jgi:hypothetical protein
LDGKKVLKPKKMIKFGSYFTNSFFQVRKIAENSVQIPHRCLDYNPKVKKPKWLVRIVKTKGKSLGWCSKNAQNGKDIVLKSLVDIYKTNMSF